MKRNNESAKLAAVMPIDAGKEPTLLSCLLAIKFSTLLNK